MTTTSTTPETGLLCDPAMPFLSGALDPDVAHHELSGTGGPLAGIGKRSRIQRITITRHKPGRRSMIEYVIEHRPRHGKPREFVMLGKARAKGLDRRAYAINRALREAGFDERNPAGICVPRPMGIAPAFKMWFQERVPGRNVGEYLRGPDGREAARRVADGLLALHSAPPVHNRRHTIAGELQILRGQFDRLSAARPELVDGLARIFRDCQRLVGALHPGPVTGIHRDFYQDNILLNGERLWIVDLDLYARGHPATDAGNLCAHLIELALREGADGRAIEESSRAFASCYVNGANRLNRHDVDVFTTLALARLIAISAQIDGRGHMTGMIMALCQERLQGTGNPLPALI